MFSDYLLRNFVKEIPSLSKKDQSILQEIKINADYPGTILADWQTMLDLIGETGIEVSKNQNYFPLKKLSEINQKLTHPILIDLKRPSQKSYPYIHGLYLLLRISGLVKIVYQASKPKLMINDELYQKWKKLNPTEQYFILLEIWMFWANEEYLEGYSSTFNFVFINNVWRLITESGINITSQNEYKYITNYSSQIVNLAMMNLFGVLELKQGKPSQGKGWKITYLAKNPVGEALIKLIIKVIDKDSSIYVRPEEEDIIYGKLQPYLTQFFPEYKQQFIIPVFPSSINKGIYVFKVSLEKVWRKIAIPSDFMLDDLADIILEAFDFDNDHLYRFICKNSLGIPFDINHPYLEEGLLTNDFPVGKLPLQVGEKMIFYFDFGDNWKFDVILEDINSPNPQKNEAEIIKSYGNPPEQYPDYDED